MVKKYGGSSLSTVEKIKKVSSSIAKEKKKGKNLVVVVSAMGKTTDNLIRLAGKVGHPEGRDFALLLSTGEIISASLLSLALQAKGVPAIAFTGREAGIYTEKIHNKAHILQIDTSKIEEELKKGKVVIITGFQGINENGEVTTLGRGASDLTAVAIAQSLKANVCEIYSDVEGIFTADPRIVKEASLISHISYEEVLEMASTGSQVMHGRAIELGQRHNLPIVVKSTFGKKEGTMIKDKKGLEGPVVSGISLNENEAKVSIFNVPDRPGIAAKIFTPLSKEKINVDMIIQNVSKKGYTDLSFTVEKTDLRRTLRLIKKAGEKIGAQGILSDFNIAKVSIIGLGMQSHPGIAAKMFSTLAREKINIEMISTSEIKISCVVKEKDGKKAVRTLHKEFIEKR